MTNDPSSATSDKLEFDPTRLEPQSVYKIMSGCIVPRPIGFIVTVDEAGIHNAAPFSFFNMVSHIPPMVAVSISPKRNGEGPKDTLANIAATREFVVNIVNNDIVEAVDLTSEPYPPDVDEIVVCGLTPVPSSIVRPPRINESPANFECVVEHILDLPGSIHTLVIGRVLKIHLRGDILMPNFRIDQARLAAVGRVAGNTYCRTSEIFSLAHDGFAAVSHHAREPKSAMSGG